MINSTDKFIFKETNILTDILKSRERNIYETTESEKELVEKETQDYDKIYSAIDNIPDTFTETIKGIKTSVENHLETLSAMQAMENEKFYKAGFSDAIKLIVDCLCKNADIKKEL